MRPIFPNYSVDANGNYTYSGTSYTFATVGGNVVIASNGSVTLPSTVTVNGNLGVNGNAFFSQSISMSTAGKSYSIKEGANSLMGIVSLVAGTATVLNTQVTASSRIFLSTQIPGGAPGFVMVSARINGTSFTISSSSGTDISTIAYLILQGT